MGETFNILTIYTYCYIIIKDVNIDAKSFSPVNLLIWNDHEN